MYAGTVRVALSTATTPRRPTRRARVCVGIVMMVALGWYTGLRDAWGPVVARPLAELPVDVPDDLVEEANVLDGFYIPTRYANNHAEGPPFEHFGVLHSDETLHHAREIIEFARPYVTAA